MLLNEDNYSCSLSKETQEVARVDLNENNKVRKKALAEVRKWIKSQPHFRRARLDSNFILRFLRMQKFEIKEACEILDKYMTMRCQYPAWFQNLDCKVTQLLRVNSASQANWVLLLILSGPCPCWSGWQRLHICAPWPRSAWPKGDFLPSCCFWSHKIHHQRHDESSCHDIWNSSQRWREPSAWIHLCVRWEGRQLESSVNLDSIRSLKSLQLLWTSLTNEAQRHQFSQPSLDHVTYFPIC